MLYKKNARDSQTRALAPHTEVKLMIPDFESRFDAAYDLRLYHQAKGYVDVSTDTWEYWVWEPVDTLEVPVEITLDNTCDDETEEF